jgi:uncharacterized protein (DUF2336 family)
MTPAAQSLLEELDMTLAQAPSDWRSTALHQMVDLFLAGATSYNDDHVGVFDEVLCMLIKKSIDRAQLADMSNKLAPVDNAPVKVVGTLARHADAAVHGPMLERAKGLPDEDIAAIIDKDKVDRKLLGKIALRGALGEVLTDVVIKRGNAAIQRKIIDNHAAAISETSFAKLIMGINGDRELAAAIARRKDVPPELRLWLDKILKGSS